MPQLIGRKHQSKAGKVVPLVHTLVARLARTNPKLMRAAPERHMMHMSHPFEMSMATKTLPLHVRPPPMVPISEAMAYRPGPSTMLLSDDV
jgi:hypothetical protein